MSAHDTPEVGSGETVGECVHWIGEHRNTLHGNGAGSKDMERASGDEDEVTCNLCLSLLARDDVRERITPASPDPVQPADAGEGLSDDGGDMEALAKELCDARAGVGNRRMSIRAADAVLASDWLKAHDAARDAVVAERIAQACEDEGRRADYGIAEMAFFEAASIARIKARP